MTYAPIDLSAFPPEREEKLRSIKRYSMFKEMRYRSDVWSHARRVFWLAETLLPLAQRYTPLDAEKVRTLALVHDDAEMLTGDIQAGAKARMTKAELKTIEENEERAIQELAKRYPTHVNNYEYVALLRHALHKDCAEAHFVSVMDKLDAYGESMHEIYSGNMTLLGSLLFYTRMMSRYPYIYPELHDFLEAKEHPLIRELGPLPVDGRIGGAEFIHFGKPHTEETIRVETRFPFYDAWRELVIQRGGDEGVAWLTSAEK
ncbi:MAG: HD domain-containing protein [Candidatus Kaiserbacteria bacterium]|nr:HD domain-containing protein [Candidatus Kaiserbacteria bacterium]